VTEAVDVVIASYGRFEDWEPLVNRALKSVYFQTVTDPAFSGQRITGGVCQIHDEHAVNISPVRNQGAAGGTAEWLIFLDADDELDSHYVEEMLKGGGDIRQPSTLGVHPDGHEDDYPVLIPRRHSFMIGNHLVIGCMIRREQFNAVGGFRDLPCLEDWDLFIRLRLAGATVGECPKAIYRVHVRPDSRNRDTGLHARVYAEIQSTYGAEWARKFG